jgi:hypothetical protein
MSLSYTFEFIVGRTVNARRVVQVNADERHTVLADRCADALDWANAKPGRQAAVKGPGLCYEYICLATIDGIARRFAPAPEVEVVTETGWTDPWAHLHMPTTIDTGAMISSVQASLPDEKLTARQAFEEAKARMSGYTLYP